jgi:hypothetical protein
MAFACCAGRRGSPPRLDQVALDLPVYEVEPLDPWTFAVTALVLLGVATVASYVPARRGMRMAPVDALRTN